MVEIFEADDINPCTDERFVRHEDYEKLRGAARRALKSLNRFGGDTPVPERYGQTALAELKGLLK